MSCERVAHFANTFVGKPGNIGVRTARIIRAHAREGGTGDCLCRGTLAREAGYRYRSMGPLGQVPRLLNAARTYLAPSFDHRRWDVALFDAFSALHLAAVLRRRPQVAHFWDVCLPAMQRCRSAGIPVFLDVPIAPYTYVERLHRAGKGAPLQFVPRHMRLELDAFELADLVIAPSAFVASELEAAGVAASRIRTVEFGVDRPAPAARASNPASAQLRFAFLGLVNRRKGVQELLEAWNTEALAGDSLHLCGRVFPDIAGLLAAGGLRNVQTPGFVDPFAYLAGCDVFVFPSWSEGSAKAVFEAMACGLPVITTASSGSVVRHGVDGFLVEPGDVAALREHMIWFKHNPQRMREMGEQARERAAAFTWDRYAGRILDLYRDAST